MFARVNHGSFAQNVTNMWSNDRLDIQDEKFLKHQKMIASYLSPETPYRGLVAFHGLGTGKTCLAVAVDSAWRKNHNSVWIITSAALRSNFLQSAVTCTGAVYSENWIYRGEKWIQHSDGTSYAELSPSDQSGVMETLVEAVAHKYKTLSLNGLNRKLIESLSSGRNSFDNSLVIIDEAHNLCRTLASTDDGLSHGLYRLIRSATGAKVLLLTGTPIYNVPSEFSYLVNMAHGPVIEHVIKWDKLIQDKDGLENARQALSACLNIDEFRVTAAGATISLTPHGFSLQSINSPHLVSSTRPSGLNAVLAEVSKTLPAKHVRTIDHDLLPTDSDVFNRIFIGARGELINQHVLARRLMGHVSVFDKRDPSLYPKVSRDTVVRVPITPEQLSEYLIVREYERKLEDKATGSSGGTTVFKHYSRVVTNFTFPRSATSSRIYKFEARGLSEGLYESRMTSALANLRGNPLWQSDIELAKLAPKFLHIYNNVTSVKGKSLVYSNFRTVEGIGLFSEMLLERGWRRLYITDDELKVQEYVKDSSGPCFIDPQPRSAEGQILIALFNNRSENLPSMRRSLELISGTSDNVRGGAIRCILISKSGTEGLDLTEIKSLHIMEPHWNDVVTDQVKGRAVRMNSHTNLPESEREVDIYMYVSTIGKSVSSKVPELQIRDRGMTSDEHIFETALMKRRQTIQVLQTMRMAAIDCREHAEGHAADERRKNDMACFVSNDEHGLSYASNINNDNMSAPRNGTRMVVQGPDGEVEVVILNGSANVYLASDIDNPYMKPIGHVTLEGKISWMPKDSE